MVTTTGSASKCVIRSGNWNNDSNAGVWNVNWNNNRSNSNNNVGSRADYSFTSKSVNGYCGTTGMRLSGLGQNSFTVLSLVGKPKNGGQF